MGFRLHCRDVKVVIRGEERPLNYRASSGTFRGVFRYTGHDYDRNQRYRIRPIMTPACDAGGGGDFEIPSTRITMSPGGEGDTTTERVSFRWVGMPGQLEVSGTGIEDFGAFHQAPSLARSESYCTTVEVEAARAQWLDVDYADGRELRVDLDDGRGSFPFCGVNDASRDIVYASLRARNEYSSAASSASLEGDLYDEAELTPLLSVSPAASALSRDQLIQTSWNRTSVLVVGVAAQEFGASEPETSWVALRTSRVERVRLQWH